MELFNLLKFWGNGGSDSSYESDDEDSFFDLVFTEEMNTKGVTIINNSFESDRFHTNNLSKRDGETKSNFAQSPNDVFHRRKILPVESNSNSKPHSPISLLRSPPKLRILMLGLKKTKPDKVEEIQIGSLFTRDNSLRSRMQKDKSDDSSENESSKRFSKDVVYKYLKLIKPLYVRVSKRTNDKTRFSDQSPFSSPATAPASSPEKEKVVSRSATFKEVCKHLVKSRSASSAVSFSPVIRRDDSALQQQDGIQSAILHCKRSYSSSSQDRSLLSRSSSDSSHEKSMTNIPRISTEEKRCSI